MSDSCEHFDAVDLDKFRNYEQCVDCVLKSDTWVNLRTCMHCGGTRCCDSSPNQHTTKHATTMGHPVILMLNNNALWCYDHEIVKSLD
ncbi:MAG: UBP-type zinc finger domain-containing protein [Candidatus Kariarchaeaceae archaeon]